MKYNKMIIAFAFIMIVVIFTGCEQNQKSYKDEFEFGQDDQYYLTRQNISLNSFAESENGYYFLNGPCYLYLYYMDKRSMNPIILCNKPQCLHTNETDGTKVKNCNAFFESPASSYYYDGFLYICEMNMELEAQNITLYQVSPDGTKRKKVYDFKHNIQRLTFHRGFIYYDIDDYKAADGPDDTTESKPRVCRTAIDNPQDQPEMLFEDSGINERIAQINAYGNDVYFLTHEFTDTTLNTQSSKLYKFNTVSKISTKIIDNILYFTFYKDKIICSDINADIKSYSLDGTDPVSIAENVGIPFGVSDNLIYVHDLSGHISLYNWNGVVTKQFDDINVTNIYGGNDCFFVEDARTSNNYGTIQSIYMLDKNIQDNQVKKIFEFIPNTSFPGIIKYD